MNSTFEDREKFFVEALLNWGRRNIRRYPWRTEKNPWRVLIAEIMLQRTTPGHVIKVYDKFLRRFPTPKSIAETELSEVENLFRPLGMIKRAKKLLETARIIYQKYDGQVPLTFKELSKLPGVGRYTAYAVLLIVRKEPYPLIDNNSARVLRRFFSLPTEKRARDDDELWKFASRLVPLQKPVLFNLALLDLGAIICRHIKAKCKYCPLSGKCLYYASIMMRS